MAVNREPGAVIGKLNEHCRPTGGAFGAANSRKGSMAPHHFKDVVGLGIEDAVGVLHIHGNALVAEQIAFSPPSLRA